METPICVVDAKTLIDHIQSIKRWIYNGQLRLVVPLSTYEDVEQIYQKSKEAKPVPKEPSRPKSSGKPIKKEYPTFDINPLLARNFLLRLKTWKEDGAASEQRDFLQEKENHGAVSFQQSSEQYSPWKDVEVEEETPQTAEDRPATWAEALRRKQNLANGAGNNSQVQKGPAKPKLVAKSAASDPSPWKIKKDAPKLSARDVPGKLRPLLSCVLWRLHESIDRNDANELFLLSDQVEIRTVAPKLNIIVRSTKELGTLLTAKAKRLDLDECGDLEREFNLPRKATRELSSGLGSRNGASDALKQPVADVAKHEVNWDNTDPEKDEVKTSDNQVNKTENGLVAQGRPENLSNRQNGHHIDEEVLVNSTSTEHAGIKEDRLEMFATKADPTGAIIVSESHSNGHQPGVVPINGTSSEAKNVMDVKPPSMPVTEYHDSPEAGPEGTPSTAPLASEQTIHTNRPTTDDQVSHSGPSTSRSAAAYAPTQPIEEAQDPEDSDEEIVVFVPQPKRFSNQKKPVQQNSRPSTPSGQPRKQITDQTPKPSPVAIQPQPKPSSRGRKPIIASHGHPQPSSSPTVIDPDAFGRSFAVNTNPGPRTLHHPRSHHRPKRSVENAPFPQGSINGYQPKSRTSPPRPLLQNKSPRQSSAQEQTTRETKSTHNQQDERASPQKQSNPVKPRDVTPQGRVPNHASPGAQSQTKSLNARMVESAEFIPRSAITDSQFGPIGTSPAIAQSESIIPKRASPAIQVESSATEPQVVDPNRFAPRSVKPIAQNPSRPVEARAPEPNNFVPRSSPVPMHYKPRMPEAEVIEPRASMPDVQYVLKSGSTRAATRGRGRLWTPS